MIETKEQELKPLETLSDVIEWALDYLDIKGLCRSDGCNCHANDFDCFLNHDCALMERKADDPKCCQQITKPIMAPCRPSQWTAEAPTELGWYICFWDLIVWEFVQIYRDSEKRLRVRPRLVADCTLEYFCHEYSPKYWLRADVPLSPDGKELL